MTLHWVFHSNGILFGWDEYKFVELTELTFEGVIASFCTSKRNIGRLEEIDAVILTLACHFLETKQMDKIIRHYNPQMLPLKSEYEKKWIVVLATNWFSSCFEEGIFSFKPRANDLLLRYLSDKTYTSELEQLTNNFFLLFSYLDLEDLKGSEELNRLIKVILKALAANHDGRSGRLWEVKYFVRFLKRNINFFSHNQIEWAIKVITKAQGWKYGFGRTLGQIFKKEGIDFQLTDEQVLAEYIVQHKNGKRDVEDFIHLFPFLSSNLQKVLSGMIEELPKSENATDLMLWLQARCNGMFSEAKELSKEQLEVFQKYFDAIEKIRFDKDGTPTNWRNDFAVNSPYWLATLHYQPNIGLGTKTIQKLLKLKSLPASMRWMLNPEDFDYKNFNCYWVFFYDGPKVLARIGVMKIPTLRKLIQKELKKEFSAKLAEVYHAYFSEE